MTIKGEIAAVVSPDTHKETTANQNKHKLFGLLEELYANLKDSVTPEKSFLFFGNDESCSSDKIRCGAGISVVYHVSLGIEEAGDGRDVVLEYEEFRNRWYDRAISPEDAESDIQSSIDDELLVTKRFNVLLVDSEGETLERIFSGYRDLENGSDTYHDISPPFNSHHNVISAEQAQMIQSYALDETRRILEGVW